MGKQWENVQISTLGRTLSDIIMKEPQPVGVIIIGVDGSFKREVFETMERQMPEMKVFGGAPITREEPDEFYRFPVTLFLLNSMLSADRALRNGCVEALHQIGFKTIIEVYVKDNRSTTNRACDCNVGPVERIRRRTIAELEQDPPTTDGLDYAFLVLEERRKR